MSNNLSVLTLLQIKGKSAHLSIINYILNGDYNPVHLGLL